ncbi:MAG TPA: choice-of-anchor P family protein, partial [Chloroflexota bacterium]|nr:choice-of-anchor P family protein [Chloroflexota bacterium]
MKKSFLRHIPRLVTLLLLISLLIWPLTAEAASLTPGSTNFFADVSGQAYAGYLKSSDPGVIASVGPLFPVGLGCATSDRTALATAGSFQIDSLTTGGALVDKVTSTFTPTSAAIQSQSTIQGLNALGGAISATSVQATASSSGDKSGATSSGSVTLTNLIVGGQAIGAHPAPNTKIFLPGIGTVTLNAQSREKDDATTAISVEAIRVDISVAGNAFGLPVGSKLIIAAASTSLQTLASAHTVGARSFALEGTGLAGPGKGQSGPWALAAIGCGGGYDKTTLT